MAEVEKFKFKKAIQRVWLVFGSSIAFGTVIWMLKGRTSALQYFTAYLVETSLSVDNLFVFILLFDNFKVPVELQPRALKWGIIGALAMRGLMISAGVAVISKLTFVVPLFAVLLMASAWRMLTDFDDHVTGQNWVMERVQSRVPVVDYFDGHKFYTLKDNVKCATPLLLCLVCIEMSDFVFAVDSIPAVLSITKDPLLVYSSNIFAMMGLRSIYTLVAKAVSELPYLRPSVAIILAFVGFKMFLEYFGFDLGTGLSLCVIMSVIGVGVALSLLVPSPTNTHMMTPEGTTLATSDDA